MYLEERALISSRFLCRVIAVAACLSLSGSLHAQRPPVVRTPFRFQPWVEKLNRGVVAVNVSGIETFVSWRMFGTDPQDIAFNLYCSTAGGTPEKLTAQPLTERTCFQHIGGTPWVDRRYFVRPVYNNQELDPSESFTLAANTPDRQYLRIPLDKPAGGTINGVNYVYGANDCSVGDVDGDGEYEMFVKWSPSNSQDNANSGTTGNTLIDCYKLNGTKLWRIDLGRNIRSGAHYTQFMVYDFDGDGKAEMACKTAPGTVDGEGKSVLMGSDDPNADYRNASGYILTGPEYLTMFKGETGANMATVPFYPDRVAVTQWGDNYGNRVDRFLGGVAYCDGAMPTLIMARGYYDRQSTSFQSRNEVVAYDWRNGTLTQRWYFKAGKWFANTALNVNSNYVGQGNHQLSVADVDGDGKDEIIYGACAIDDNGSPLYSTGWGHGDALHVSDMLPSRPGLEVFMPHESQGSYGPNCAEFRDARTGALIFGMSGTGDNGRGVAMDIDPRYPGYEMWSASIAGLYTASLSTPDAVNGPRGVQISTAKPSNQNFAIWWDGDLLREILDGSNNDSTSTPPVIRKWNWSTSTVNTIFTATECYSNNNSKGTPGLCADILGDWREEAIWRKNDSTELRIFTTVIPTNFRLYTLMHDRQYRVSVAWQNTAYNQPTHPGFFLGDGMTLPLPRVGVAAP